MWDSIDLIPFSGIAVYTILGIVLDQTKESTFTGLLALLLAAVVASISSITYLHLKVMLMGYHNLHQIIFRTYGIFVAFLVASFVMAFAILIIAIFAQSFVYHIYFFIDLVPAITPRFFELCPETFDYWAAFVIMVLIFCSGISKYINRTTSALLNLLVIIGYCVNLMIMRYRNKHCFFRNTIFHVEYERTLDLVNRIFFAFGIYPIFMSLLNRCEILKLETEYCMCWIYTMLLYLIPAVIAIFYSCRNKILSYALFPSSFGRASKHLVLIWSFLPALFNVLIILMTFGHIHIIGTRLTVDGLFINYPLVSSASMLIPSLSLLLISVISSIASIVLLPQVLMQLASVVLILIFLLISYTTMIFPLLRQHPLLACPCVYGQNRKMTDRELYELYCNLNYGKKKNKSVVQTSYFKRSSNTAQHNNNKSSNQNNNKREGGKVIFRYQCNCSDYDDDVIHLECRKCTKNLRYFVRHYYDNHASHSLLPTNINYHNKAPVVRNERSKSETIIMHTLNSVGDLVDIKQFGVCFVVVLYMGSLFIYMRSVYMLKIPFRIGFFVIIVVLGLFSVTLSAPYVLNQCPEERITFSNPLASVLFPILSLSLLITILSSYTWKIYLFVVGYAVLSALIFMVFGINNSALIETDSPMDNEYFMNVNKGIFRKLFEDVTGGPMKEDEKISDSSAKKKKSPKKKPAKEKPAKEKSPKKKPPKKKPPKKKPPKKKPDKKSEPSKDTESPVEIKHFEASVTNFSVKTTKNGKNKEKNVSNLHELWESHNSRAKRTLSDDDTLESNS